MQLIDVDLKPDRKKLKQFGFIALLFFGILGWWALSKGRLLGFGLGDASTAVGWSLIGLAAVSGLLSIVAPSGNLALYLVLTYVTLPIGFVASYVLLGSIFYLLITPFGLFFRLVGRDPLNLKLDPEAETYWTRRSMEKVDVGRYFKQY